MDDDEKREAAARLLRDRGWMPKRRWMLPRRRWRAETRCWSFCVFNGCPNTYLPQYIRHRGSRFEKNTDTQTVTK